MLLMLALAARETFLDSASPAVDGLLLGILRCWGAQCCGL
jgi:hypothetical protein